MKNNISPEYEALSRIIKSLAHPTRIFIVEELAKNPLCVCELQERIGADISTVSKHLSVLKNSGLVQDEKRGTSIYYKLCCPCILDFIGCIETVLKTNVEKQMNIAQCCGIKLK